MKVEYYLDSGYVGSERKETVEVDVSDCKTQAEIEKVIEEDFQTWVWEHINTHWEIIEE